MDFRIMYKLIYIKNGKYWILTIAFGYKKQRILLRVKFPQLQYDYRSYNGWFEDITDKTKLCSDYSIWIPKQYVEKYKDTYINARPVWNRRSVVLSVTKETTISVCFKELLFDRKTK